ncbi:MAG TPA: FAD-binding oxidoreductase [Solirubrobacteraceae bacterium]|nr:FAD-binding oxidoreductase [Solirubrobacteraceae bacterium]
MSSTVTNLHPPAPAPLIAPGEPGWDEARGTYNLLIDQRPAAIARPANEREAAAAIGHARELGLRVAAQATGHNAAPLGDLSATMLLNTSRLDELSIDADARRVRVGAGVKWERVVPALSELGLAALHGSSPDVSVVGYSLGGGVGWLARSHGLQCNSVTAVELVTAEGDLLRVDAAREPDLFWALRGGGGSFGVVTAIEFEVYPVSRVHAGAMFFGFERSAEVLGLWAELVEHLPDEITTWVQLMNFPDLPDVPEPMRGRSFAAVLGSSLLPEAEVRRQLAPLRELGPVMDTFADGPAEILGELAMDPPDPVPYRTAHSLVDSVPSGVQAALIDAGGPSSGLVVVQVRHLGGALSRPPAGAGARATLDGEFSVFAVAPVFDPALEPAAHASLASVEAAVADVRCGDYASFVERPSDASAFYPAETWERLRAVKALYDPADVIRGNHHVSPR